MCSVFSFPLHDGQGMPDWVGTYSTHIAVADTSPPPDPIGVIPTAAVAEAGTTISPSGTATQRQEALWFRPMSISSEPAA